MYRLGEGGGTRGRVAGRPRSHAFARLCEARATSESPGLGRLRLSVPSLRSPDKTLKYPHGPRDPVFRDVP